jgi:hypothetical protein
MVGWHHFAQPQATDRTTYDGPGLKRECTRCRKTKVFHYEKPTIGGGPLVGGGEAG